MMEQIYNILNTKILGNTITEHATALGIIIIGIIVVSIFKIIVFKRLEKRAKETLNKFDDFLANILKKTLFPALYFGVFYIASKNLKFSESIMKSISTIGMILITFLGIRFIISLISFLITNYWMRQSDSATRQQSVKSIMPFVKIAIWGIGTFFLLDNLGFKVSTLLAGLGIGGVAVALAAQAVLGDLFSYFAILFDKPFTIGDFIIIGEYMGTIEHIGIKTTRIRSLGGEQLVFSNQDLTGSRVRNYKRMQQRRVVFEIGVIYQTTKEQLEAIPNIIKEIIESIERTTFDRSHFKSFGDFSLDFETVYFVMSSDYAKYMDVQQKINLKLVEEFEKRKIEFAYPTQTLFLEKTEATS